MKIATARMRGERGQALMEMAVGMLALAMVVSALVGFAFYIVRALEIENELRVGGRKTDTVEVSDFAADHIFGSATLKIEEKLQFPSREILR